MLIVLCDVADEPVEDVILVVLCDVAGEPVEVDTWLVTVVEEVTDIFPLPEVDPKNQEGILGVTELVLLDNGVVDPTIPVNQDVEFGPTVVFWDIPFLTKAIKKQ